ncbi:serine hydrolase FSH [Xylariales sp. PMI_506]|nr:serine hydrolase FSH [Xylariales sp. PMI_506]
MKILCLHGKGTSGKIFDTQSISFRHKLKDSNIEFSFDFVDGPHLSAPAPDITLFYEPPYYKFWDDATIPSIRVSHEWLSKILEQRGPYDGVMGFSQGCSLISSFLMYRQWYEPELPPPFKFAMFICGGMPLSVLKDLGVPVSKEAEELDLATRTQLQEKTTGEVTIDRWQTTDYAAKVRQAQFDSDDCFGLNLNTIPKELRIRIPTAHVFGSKDPRLPAGVQLAGMCDPYLKKVYDHGGGHEIPRKKEVSEELASMLQWCAQRGAWPGQE